MFGIIIIIIIIDAVLSKKLQIHSVCLLKSQPEQMLIQSFDNFAKSNKKRVHKGTRITKCYGFLEKKNV